MSDNPYEIAKGGRLCFKGGALATRSHGAEKEHKKKKKKDKKQEEEHGGEQLNIDASTSVDASGEAIYTIDAAKKMKYEDIFPVETKKFGYDPKAYKSRSVEEALDDRVKKKADRYCK